MTRPVIARDALGDLIKLGQGGQGVVYRAPKIKTKFADSMVFKEYKPRTRAVVNFEALSAMPALVEEILPDSEGKKLVSIAAWPCALVETTTGPTGFVMPGIPDSFFIPLTTVKGVSQAPAEFQHLLNPPSVLGARGITISDAQRHELLLEVAKALAFLHRIGVCVGDISPKNLLFSLRPSPTVYFVDCDAMRLDGISALPQVETPDWQVPRGEELATVESDTYKLGLLAVRLLAGSQHIRDAEAVPPNTPRPLRQLITDTLCDDPDRRPLPEAWTYLLGQVVEATKPSAQVTHTPKPSNPAPTHPREPQPVVKNRPTATPPTRKPPAAAKAPAPSTRASAATQTSSDDPKHFWAWVLLAGLIVVVPLGFIIHLSLSNSEPSRSSRPTTPAPSSPPLHSSTRTTSQTSPVSSLPVPTTPVSIEGWGIGDELARAFQGLLPPNPNSTGYRGVKCYTSTESIFPGGVKIACGSGGRRTAGQLELEPNMVNGCRFNVEGYPAGDDVMQHFYDLAPAMKDARVEQWQRGTQTGTLRYGFNGSMGQLVATFDDPTRRNSLLYVSCATGQPYDVWWPSAPL